MNSRRLIIMGAEIYSPVLCHSKSAVLIEGGRITRIGTVAEAETWPEGQKIEANGLLLVPGLIEIQINGAFGMDFTERPETIYPVARELSRFGVTRFLPTIITSPLEKIQLAQSQIRSGPPDGFLGAVPIGLHVEGPFLNPERKGAHSQEYLRPPSLDDASQWSKENGVRLVTLAPELPGADEVIAFLRQRGVIVSAGHSLATLQQAQNGFKTGICCVTHLFNAMSPLNHFDPGLPGAVLAEPSLRFGLIPDGIHVHPTLVGLVWRLTGAGQMILVTDAMAALGMPPGLYRLGKQEVVVDGTSARLHSGNLAGSILPHPTALRNLIAFTGCSLSDALSCMTSTPAELLGMEDEIGRIEEGYRADLVLLTPDLDVVCTVVDGEIVFQS